jgi:hypothetical protein
MIFQGTHTDFLRREYLRVEGDLAETRVSKPGANAAGFKPLEWVG